MQRDPVGVPLSIFCEREGVGSTTVRKMLADGRIKAFRVGSKKLMIDVASYREFVAKQLKEGMPSYTKTEAAVAAHMAKRTAEQKNGVEKNGVVKARKVKPAEALAMTLSDLGLA